MADARTIDTLDCEYLGQRGVAAAYLLTDGGRAAFVETCTAHALPTFLAALAARGLSPDAVELVIVTHAHLDHAGGASALMEACPHATLIAHPRAARHLIDPTKLVASATEVYGAEAFHALYGTIRGIPAARVRAMEDGDSLTFGRGTLRFLHTRGHANHHFCVLDEASGAIFTGDAFGLVYPALQGSGRLALPSSSPTDFDAAEARASVARIRTSGATRAYLTHFGGHEDLDEIAAQLDALLASYGEIVEEGVARGDEGPALDLYCANFVDESMRSLLASRGLAGDAAVAQILETDRTLNAQGLAVAVRRRLRRAADAGVPGA
jgi:glyoxylase-like metal-dependent hydrolase (beta-lactamase superfamily II)